MDLRQGDLENIILNAIWSMEEEQQTRLDVRDVQEKIKTASQSWAYTTVKTVLDRLVDKQLVSREKDGKKFVYKSLLARQDAAQNALKRVAKQYFRNNFQEVITIAEKLQSLSVK